MTRIRSFRPEDEDALTELSGGGWGRRLIQTLADSPRRDGMRGLLVDADNVGAIAFSERLGFVPLPPPEGAQAFGRTL